MNARSISTVIVSVTSIAYFAAPVASASPQQRRRPQLLQPQGVNLAVSSFQAPQTEGRLTAFIALESQEGFTDLNGDGDTDDAILHIFDRTTGQLQNLRLASTVYHVDGALVAFLVDEASQGLTDLNGDGDALDQVAFIHDLRTGLTRNLGVGQGIEALAPRVGGNLVTFVADELSQGGVDLNGDGDVLDAHVLHVHDTQSGITTNLALTTRFAPVFGSGGVMGFPVSEFDQGQTDLNGDNDIFDTIVYSYDSATGISTNLGWAIASPIVQSDGSRLLFDVSEHAQGVADLNGDGDHGDRVAFVYDAATFVTTNLGLAMSSADLSGDLVIVAVDEASQGGADINGDGDITDRIDHVYDLTTGLITNFGLSSAGFLRSGRFVASRVFENGQGFTDLNGDGDTDDVVLHVHDAVTGQTINLGLAAEPDFQLAGALVAFRVAETAQGGVDLNGDTDTSDAVLHVYDSVLATTRNLGLAQSFNGIQVHARRVAFKVRESDQGGISLNGDGDASDDVLHIYDSRNGTTINLRLAVEDFDLYRKTLMFEVPEADQDNLDLNGDQDALDDVVHVARL